MNGYGLCDMSGNVWEWNWDWKGEYDNDVVTDPKGEINGTRRVIRGGGWIGSESNVRVSDRYGDKPKQSNVDLGFRLVRLAN